MQQNERRTIASAITLFIFVTVWWHFQAESLAQGPGINLGPWYETTEFADPAHRSHPLPSFAVGSYYYVHTKTNEGANDRIVYYARQRPDGSLTPWSIAIRDHGGGPHGYTAVATETTAYHFRNGHIAQYVFDSTGRIMTIRLLENPDIRLPFSGNKYMWDTAAYAPSRGQSHIYHLGGFDMASYGYSADVVHRSPAPIAPTGAYFQPIPGFDAPTTNPSKATFYSKPTATTVGYIYMGDRFTSRIYRALLMASDDSTPGPWLDSGTLPPGNGNKLGDMFVIGDSLFVIRGSKVFKASINSSDGSLGAWDDSPPDLPEAQIDLNWYVGNTEGASYGIIGDYVYVTGPRKVFYAKILGRPHKTYLTHIKKD